MELNEKTFRDIIKTETENLLAGRVSKTDFDEKMLALKVDIDDAQKAAVDKAVADVSVKYDEALKEMGNKIEKMKGQAPQAPRTMFDVIEANKEFFQTHGKSGGNIPNTAIELKALSSASLSGASGNATNFDINAVVKNTPFFSALLTNRITMPANNEGYYVYYEQVLNTNNTDTVAEATAVASNNVYTWIKKSIQSSEVKSKTVINIRQLLDTKFLTDTVNGLMAEDWVLKVEDLLINSPGTGITIAGILSYATEFAFASATKSKNPNLMDVLRKVKAQITKQGKNKFKPSLAFMAVDAVEEMAGTKDDFGRYLMPNWAMGGDISFSGVNILENELANDNQVVMGDMSKAKLVIWDDMVLRVFQENDDASAGRVTIQVEGRLNLLVKTNNKPAIVKVTSLSAAIAGIEYIGE